MKHRNIAHALAILADLGFPRAQQNDRSALALLALSHVTPSNTFADTIAPLLGITPIMTWVREHYEAVYAPNTRETFRRQTMHQFRDAGLVLYNPDDPTRPVNSPRAVYQLAPEAVVLLKRYGTPEWAKALDDYLAVNVGLAARYARARSMAMVPVVIEGERSLQLSPGAHSQLIAAVIEQFAPRFAPGSDLVYAGDTGEKQGWLDKAKLASLGVQIDDRGKMPDVVLIYKQRNWLLLVEAVTSHGPVDPKRHGELSALFAGATARLVYVTAFPDRATMARYVSEIAWETDVWTADAPSHLIHFNGDRFLGPYA